METTENGFDVFLAKLKKLKIHFQTIVHSGNYTVKTKVDPFIELDWVTGGITGGSCWGGEADQPIESEKEPDFSELDLILEEFAPNITYLQYKKL